MSITFENEVAIRISGERFRFWDSMTLSRRIDSMDILQLGAPFDSGDRVYRDTFRPLLFRPISADVNDEDFFTGTISPIDPTMTATESTSGIGAYSLPGVLDKCTVPISSLPVQFSGLTLHEIAAKLLDPFDIEIDARVGAGDVFKKVAFNPSQKILPFLTGLAQQRNQIMSSSEIGDLIFWQGIDDAQCVADLRQGESPLLTVTPQINPDEYYSEITGIKTTKVGSKVRKSFTAFNPMLAAEPVFRPYIFEVDDARDGDLETAVNAKLARMFANAVKYSATVATWRDPNGALWAPNTIVRLTAPDAMIYNPYDFLVTGIDFRQTAREETAALELAIPGAFAATANPGALPWDE